MERLTQFNEDYYEIKDDKGNLIAPKYSKLDQVITKLGKLEDIEEELGLSLKTLLDICDNKLSIVVDYEKMTMTILKEDWKDVKIFIPVSFNSSSIYCDVWYEEDFKGYTRRLPLSIKEINKSWWVKEDRSE